MSTRLPFQTTASQHEVSESSNPVKVPGKLRFIYHHAQAWTTHLQAPNEKSYDDIFDSFGLILPVTISTKLVLQQLWQERISWNNTLNDDRYTRWIEIADTIAEATTLLLPCKWAASLSSKSPPATVARTIDITKYKKLAKLHAVTVYVLRLINHAKHTNLNINNFIHLLPAEISLACVKWIYAAQHDHFSAEMQSLQQSQPLRLLVWQRLFLGKDVLLRCNGWIHNAPLSDLARFLYFLPSKHHFTNLVILQADTQLHHTGISATLSLIHQRYGYPRAGNEYDHSAQVCHLQESCM